ncbi:MAG: beta-ketoacyl synthase N-terminal-like domain-containing protein [Limisphaerales bacterium]
MGLGAHVGPWSTLRAFQERVLGGRNEDEPVAGGADIPGYHLEDLVVPVNRYRIPPRELAELLPQQALMLETARAALADAQTPPVRPERAGVFIGLGLDPRTTDFHHRWATLAQGSASGDPALTADRTMGALAGINASRIAKEFRFGGPSHTVGCEECSGTKALEIAVRALQAGELDQALVGAVDLTGDLRALLATDALRPFSRSGAARPFDAGGDGWVPGEGAVALVVKRLDDARRDGDRIYAVIRGIGSASGGEIGGLGEGRPAGGEAARAALQRAYAESGIDPATVGYLEPIGFARPEADREEVKALEALLGSSERQTPCRLGSAHADVGHAGAAAGLVAVVKTCLVLHQEILPALRGLDRPLPELEESRALLAPWFPQYWVRNRAEGPRRAGVCAASVDGNFMHVVLEAVEDEAGERGEAGRLDPLGARTEALFVLAADDRAGLLKQTQALRDLAMSATAATADDLSRTWWRMAGGPAWAPSSNQRLALVAQDREQLLRLLEQAIEAVSRGEPDIDVPGRAPDRDRLFLATPETRIKGGIAFVFPGAGNTFAGMGRELALLWPGILRAQDRENEFLAAQLNSDRFWTARSPGGIGTDHRAAICGQVALGAMVSDLARSFGLQPDAVLGYSLGESTGLFALRAWTARDEMLRRVTRSTLFAHDLTGTPESLRRAWGLPESQPVEWQAGLVDRSAAEVRAAIAGRPRIHVLIVNTPDECVIGGDATEVRAVVTTLGCHWFLLEGVSTVHCELLRPVESAYRELHQFETSAPAGIRFYSGGWGRDYPVDAATAAEAIVAQASDGVDFPRVVRAAYDSGIRFFLEMGPGNSCSRMIGRILEGRPHVARSWCASSPEPLLAVWRALGQCFVGGCEVDLSRVYAAPGQLAGREETDPARPVPSVSIAIASPLFRTIRPKAGGTGDSPVPVGDSPPASPATERQMNREWSGPALAIPAETAIDRPVSRLDEPVPSGSGASSRSEIGGDRGEGSAVEPTPDPFESEFLRGLQRAQSATLTAHEAFLSFSQGLFGSLADTVQSQLGLIPAGVHAPAHGVQPPERAGEATSSVDQPAPGSLPAARGESVESTPPASATAARAVLDRAACLEFARGSVAAVLGEGFRPVDGFPTRVRLPDEPLMLVDRIVEFEGEARSMTQGRVVTEHDVHPGAWYLDGGRIPTCIAVEAGQADLFLSGYLGIDFETEGKAVYRLLDAKVCFHRSLPGPGKVIRYDIRIDGFFRQASTWLFRFNFEATVDGEPLLTMTEGCAGFFTAQELAEGRGIVRTALDREPRPGVRSADGEALVPVTIESYSAAQLDALRAGDFAACFGPAFASLPLRRPVALPEGRMKLVHRIPLLDPNGGRYGLGLVRGEADIHPDDWFLTCHFVDDRVMPGTLMFECCLHTLRVFLLRWGWIVEQDGTALEPIPGIVSQLKCRGQVLETTALVTYEVAIKEMGCGPEPYVIADALMYADGRAIVEITNLNLRYAGATAATLRRTWAAGRTPATSRALYGPGSILAFAIGKPSEAFGAPYRVFDEQRRIARLPGPPYQFLDRIVEVEGEPFKMVPGGVAVAEYDVPPDAWYFAANRQGDMPFAVLLEIALQPCGWLAAYVGSALTSDTDLSFRNLGGKGTQSVPVHADVGTLTTRVKMTRLSSSAGMIIQWFDFEVRAGATVVYQGDTYFGFFPQAALARQEGLRDAALYQPLPAELARARQLAYPTDAPFPEAQLRMVDHIELHLPEGGPHGLGFIRATKRVEADEWFFKAHFFQDPVVPGSLGLESFLQLLKFAAIERWGHTPGTRWEAVAVGAPHEWIYRGQVIPADRLVTVEVAVTKIDEATRRLTADGFLSVDGRVIYGLKDFTVQRREMRAGVEAGPGAGTGRGGKR